MRAVLQRVSEASVTVEGRTTTTTGEIGLGLLILLGVEAADDETDIAWLVNKVTAMRIFGDEDGKMNRSILDVDGEALVVSQFTLHASTKKGNRPSFIKAARPDHAIPMYEAFCQKLGTTLGKAVATGEFGAHMDVHLVNDGPVTILIDSKNRE